MPLALIDIIRETSILDITIPKNEIGTSGIISLGIF